MDHFPNILDDILDLEEDSDDDFELMIAAVLEEEEMVNRGQLARYKGSVFGHRVIDRSRHEGHDRLWNDYFSSNPVYPDHLFRRRFRMRRPLFCRIIDGVVARNEYFRQKPDALGVLGLSSIQKITDAMRMLAYGLPADSVDKYVRIGESTVFESLRAFVVTIVEVYGGQYLRAPNSDDISRLLSLGEQNGFPGMLGSIDCMHWRWKNCPTAWQGMYTGHCQTPTIILEAVASSDLWIWHAFFGMPGALNDINVLDRSPVFDTTAHGHAPQVNYHINGHDYTMGYYLADGIYPGWATFVKTISCPVGLKNKHFTTMQEARRKDVERAFGVLQARFGIVRGPARCWDVQTLANIMKACIILHNMIIEDEGIPSDIEFDGANAHPPEPVMTGDSIEVNQMFQSLGRIKSSEIHSQLKCDLIEHLWAIHGDK